MGSETPEAVDTIADDLNRLGQTISLSRTCLIVGVGDVQVDFQHRRRRHPCKSENLPSCKVALSIGAAVRRAGCHCASERS